jgi:hypothetical protein
VYCHVRGFYNYTLPPSAGDLNTRPGSTIEAAALLVGFGLTTNNIINTTRLAV